MSETMSEWRECADPDELAAAVAAGVEVRDAVRLLDLAWGVIANADGWGDDTSWRQAAERWRDGYHRFLDALREEPTAPPAPTPPPAPPWPGDDDWCGAVLNDLNSIIHQHCGSDGSDDAHCDWVNDLANEVVRYFQRPDVLPAPPPVPPWPGAVLSGLVDEDGVPTWLAQAGQVRGDQGRGDGAGSEVVRDTSYGEDEWVEVRAPRAVPEPETERVPVLDAIRDRIELTHPEGEFLAVGVELREDGDLVAIEQQEPWGKAQPVAPDGTVEVLRDGGR